MHVQKIRQDSGPVRGHDGFRMELEAKERMDRMPYRHDFTGPVSCRDCQLPGKRFLVRCQGMIAGCFDCFRQAMKQGIACIDSDRALFAVHQLSGRPDPCAEAFANGLMAQTDAQDGDAAGQETDQLFTYTGIFGITRPRG